MSLPPSRDRRAMLSTRRSITGRKLVFIDTAGLRKRSKVEEDSSFIRR